MHTFLHPGVENCTPQCRTFDTHAACYRQRASIPRGARAGHGTLQVILALAP